MARRACIDIGSNTTRLLVADDASSGLSVVHEQRAFTRIGASFALGGLIPDAKRAEVVQVVADQLRRARELGADEVHAVATAAVRTAANGALLIAELHAAAGLSVQVLSGASEAQLAFCGAAGMLLGPRDRPLGVVDVGGGSSEVVIGDPGMPGGTAAAVQWWVSLGLGSGSLAAAHLHHDPPTPAEISAAWAAAGETCDGVVFDGPLPARTVAVGGSATSLGRVTGPRLDLDALASALDVLCSAPSAQVGASYGIDPERVRLLPAGLIVLHELAGRLGGVIEVGCGGIREGVLLQASGR